LLSSIITALYVLAALALTVYAISQLILIVVYVRQPRPPVPLPLADKPRVVIQLPIYNEPHVVARLIDAAAQQDYPRDRFTIQILDDSTDQTTSIAAAKAREWSARGVHIDHIRRGERTGYKAGALAYGLTRTDAVYAAVFDADFAPPPHFLRAMLPSLIADPNAACVQGRWGHLNPFDNALTLMQTIALDGHFVVEQGARMTAGFFANFNGSGGIWRIDAIEKAGGWRDATLTEDLDLSYRVQLDGGRIVYRPDVVVPAELPASLAAYKQQQMRWARGATQCMRLMLPRVLRAGAPPLKTFMSVLHLCQYLVHPLMVLLVLFTPPLLSSGALLHVPLSVLGVFGIIPPMLFIVSQRALYPTDWKRRLLGLPVLVVLGMGLSWSNSRAVLHGLFSVRGEFRRTPKTAGRAASLDQPRFNLDWLGEAALMLYALGGMMIALRVEPGFAGYLALYAAAYGVFALVSVRDAWRAGQHQVSYRWRFGSIIVLLALLSAVALGHFSLLAQAVIIDCPNVLESRLIVRERARVSSLGADDPLNMRDAPGTDSEIIGRIPIGGVFYVLSGPECTQRYTWYQVDYRGVIGYVAEGDATVYFTEPYPPAP
jgi:cellulose synthase/poly-beta-1,6-N-acetylglucosamine synthase-like glycosyltransferase